MADRLAGTRSAALACTEFTLIADAARSLVSLLNTTELHARTAVDLDAGERSVKQRPMPVLSHLPGLDGGGLDAGGLDDDNVPSCRAFVLDGEH